MNRHLITFEPLDSVFFRDGRPYTHGESDQANIPSLFPPNAATLIGALRAALARSLGWQGDGDWPVAIKTRLGDGLDLAELRFRGPLLLRNRKPLFPAPSNLVRDKHNKTALLTPGPKQECDLGQVHLPELPAGTQGEGWKILSDTWVDAGTLAGLLTSEVPKPDSLLSRKSLWKEEPHVGIARDAETRTTGESALYSPRHVRLATDVALGLEAEGLETAFCNLLGKRMQPLGGEGRSAWIELCETTPVLPPAPALRPLENGFLTYAVHVLSPLSLRAAPEPGRAVSGLPGTLVSACLPRVQMRGGWDSLHRTPLPLKARLTPGSVLFMKCEAAEADRLRALHNACIGTCPAWGDGWIALGTWREA